MNKSSIIKTFKKTLYVVLKNVVFGSILLFFASVVIGSYMILCLVGHIASFVITIKGAERYFDISYFAAGIIAIVFSFFIIVFIIFVTNALFHMIKAFYIKYGEKFNEFWKLF